MKWNVVTLAVVALGLALALPQKSEAVWPFRTKKEAAKTPVVEKAPITAFDTPHMWYYDPRMNQKRCLTLKQARRSFLDPRLAIKPCPPEKLEKE